MISTEKFIDLMFLYPTLDVLLDKRGFRWMIFKLLRLEAAAGGVL